MEEFSGLNDQNFVEDFSIQPNPTNGEFIILGAEFGSEYRIQSLNGIEVLKGIVKSTKHMVDVNSFDAGLYIISIQGNQKKILKL